MTIIRAAATASLLIAICGCAASPVSKIPPPTKPAPVRHALIPPSHLIWWRGFGNEELLSLILQAEAHNSNMEGALARVDQARAGLRLARAPLLPSASLTSTATRQAANASSGALSGNFGYVEAVASWEIDVWGRLRAQVRSARKTFAASQTDVEAVRLEIDSEVARAWFSSVELRERLLIAQDDLRNAQGVLEQVQARKRAGEALEGDEAAQAAAVADSQSSVASIERALAVTLANLAVLTGSPPHGFTIETKSIDDITQPILPKIGLPSDLLLRRPDIASAALRLEAAGDDVEAAQRAMLPQITLSAYGGAQVTGPSQALYSLVAGLTAPLFDHGALSAQRDFAKGVHREREADYRGAAINALGDVQKALSELEFLEREVASRRASYNDAAVALANVKARYLAGSETLLAVLEAERVLSAKRDTLVFTQSENFRAFVDLYAALGGGWAGT